MTFNFIPKHPPTGKNKIQVTKEMAANWQFEDNHFYNIFLTRTTKTFYQRMHPSELKARLKDGFTGLSYLNKDKLVDLVLKYHCRKQCAYCNKTAVTTNKLNLEFACRDHIRK